jgi:hypothetical protein
MKKKAENRRTKPTDRRPDEEDIKINQRAASLDDAHLMS